MNNTEERTGWGRTLRNVVIGVLVVIGALSAGFGTGYILRDRKVQELRELMAQQKEDMTARINALEKQVLEAQKSQLERQLARAKVKVDLEELLGSLAAAAAEVEQRNFGRAIQKIGAAKGILTASGGASAAVREALGAKLDEIKAGLEQLDVKVREQITSLAKELEEGTLAGASPK